MKKAFLLWFLSISLATASNIKEDLTLSFASGIKMTPGERLNDWGLEGDFDNTFISDYNLNRQFIIKPNFDNSSIEDILLLGYKGGGYVITIHTTNKVNVSLSSKFDQRFRNAGFSKSFSATEYRNFPEFLKFFYQNQYLPDCIVDLIFKKMAQRGVLIEEFRLTSEKILSDLNQFLTPDSCEEDVQNFLTQKLTNVINPARRQDLMAWVIVSLQESNPGISLIKTWAQKITDPSATLLYGQVKLIQSDIEMNDDLAQPDQQMRHRQALQTLLNIPSTLITSEIQSQINILIKYIYKNNQLNNDPLPSALKNIQVNSKSIIDMIVYMSQLSQKNEQL